MRTLAEEEIREAASQFTCKSHFMDREYGAYIAAKKLGILNDLEFAVSREKNRRRRCM